MIKSQRNLSFSIGLALILSLSSVYSVALPLSPDDILISHTIFMGNANASTASYHNNTDTYMSTNRTPASNPASILIGRCCSGSVANDIVGVNFIEANIDSSGRLVDGTFAWIGSSESLGIVEGTTLISATLTDVHYDMGLFQYRARIDVVSPALSVVMGPVKSLLIWEFAGTDVDFDTNPWNANFLGDGPTSSPTVYVSSNALPLTISESLATFTTGATTGSTSSYDSVNDEYVINADFSTSGAPAFLYAQPGSNVITNDIIGDFTLNAIIDDDGNVSSGTAVWSGGSVALGIPPNTELISGTVVETIFTQSVFMLGFQSLVLVDDINPALGSEVGPIQSLVITDFQSPGAVFVMDPWSVGFSHSSFTTSPEIYGSPSTMMNSDTDADGIGDLGDNCVVFSNGDQRDADVDGIGSYCDGDFSNDCFVNFADLAFFANVFGTSNPSADMNGDGSVNFIDFALWVDQFGANYEMDNPSSVPNICVSPLSSRRKLR